MTGTFLSFPVERLQRTPIAATVRTSRMDVNWVFELPEVGKHACGFLRVVSLVAPAAPELERILEVHVQITKACAVAV